MALILPWPGQKTPQQGTPASKASDKANAATAAVDKTKHKDVVRGAAITARDAHLEAADEHTKAMMKASKAGDTSTAEEHQSKMNEHMRQANSYHNVINSAGYRYDSMY